MDVGTEINHYQVVEHIGRGGMADVWSARDTRLNRMVAIKTIARELDRDDSLEMFKREAQTIAQMEHPHILPIYDFGNFSDSLYIVMRYMAGGSLADVMERGQMPVEEVLRIGNAIALALDHAHNSNIVHLDLKPQNILLDSTQQAPYLADFGLATVLDREGRAANPGSGTLMYMAPEQLTAEVIDSRADVYSFSIVLYHMFSGHLPFEGRIPLAMNQLQFHEDLPDLDELPAYVSEILRRGVAMDLDTRPQSLMDMLNELRSVLVDAVDMSSFQTFDDDEDMLTTFGDVDDIELLEAIDIYSRAHSAWANGQGRFLLGVTHFMFMESYYAEAEDHGLTLDLAGKQMLLRGALEYDLNIDFWWGQLDEDNRRWVCLHAIRSENAPARIRALYRLETLPDSEPPRIPRLVAQALQVEIDQGARKAALYILATRARLRKRQVEYDIRTEYRGMMLSTMTRLDIQVRPESDWHESVYAPEIDTLIATIALDRSDPEVAELAARAVGRIRSVTAVRFLAEQQQLGRSGALRALGYVRDEAPNLPNDVAINARIYAWWANTLRRHLEHPLSLTWRFLFAVIGAWLGAGWQVYATFRAQALFTPQRYANTIGFGLAFAILIGVLVMVADEIPARVRGFWPWWSRLILSSGIGFVWGTLTWGAVHFLWFQNPVINWDMMLIAGFGLSSGFVLSSMLNLRGWIAVLLSTIGIYLPIYAIWNNYCTQVGFCAGAPAFSVSPAPMIGLLVGMFAGTLLRIRSQQPSPLPHPKPPWLQLTLSAALGLLWATVAWVGFVLTFQTGSILWAGVLGFVLYGLVTGALFTFFLNTRSRLSFGANAVAAFGALFALFNPIMQDPAFAPPADFLLFFDFNEHLFIASIPFALLTAVGGYVMLLRRDFLVWRATRHDALAEAAPETEDTPLPEIVIESEEEPIVVAPFEGGDLEIVFDEEIDSETRTEEIELDLTTRAFKSGPQGDDMPTVDIDSEIKRLHDEDQ